MIIKNIKQVLSLKFIILTICIFAAISISSKNLLVDLINSNYLNVSINSLSAYDIILSVFLLLDYEYSIKYFLYILSIYLIPLLILSNFLYRQITEYSYYTIMRLKSYYIFIFNLISAIVIVSIVYFILGYSTIILMNLDKVDIQNGIFSILYKNNFSYFRLILRSLFINNLIIISLVGFIVTFSIICSNFYTILGITTTFLSMGIVGNLRFLPGYHAILFNSIDYKNFKISNDTYIFYLILIIFTIVSLVYSINFKKHLISNINNSQ